MSITRKIFIYSIGVTFSIILLLLSYFLFMLSPLYANYLSNARYNNIHDIQVAQINNTFENQKQDFADSGLNFISVIVPKNGYEFTISILQGNIDIEIIDNELRNIIDQAKNIDMENATQEDMDLHFKKIWESFTEFIDKSTENQFMIEENPYFKVKDNTFKEIQNVYSFQDTKVHNNGDLGFIFETQVSDSFSFYTSYIALSEHDDNYYVTMGTAATPKLRELQPVIVSSLPSILLVSILLIITSTYLFSRLFITPMRKLSITTYDMQHHLYKSPEKKISPNTKDEFQQLELLIDTLYTDLQTALTTLQSQNETLAQSNQTQQVFLMGSSHQLKTPIASALLLIEGMIGEIGRYADTTTYLPKVRNELINMRSIVDEILELNRTEISEETYVELDIADAVQNILQKHTILIQENELKIDNMLTSFIIKTNELFIYKILDNVIKNAIVYTPKQQQIKIYEKDQSIIIENFGIIIDKTFLPQVFEPFVRKTSHIKGHGLGLYIATYYAKLLNIEVSIKNNYENNSVLTIISF